MSRRDDDRGDRQSGYGGKGRGGGGKGHHNDRRGPPNKRRHYDDEGGGGSYGGGSYGGGGSGGGKGKGKGGDRSRESRGPQTVVSTKPPARARVKLVELLVTVADVYKRSTTDRDSVLADNLRDLADVLAQSQLAEDGDSVAKQLVLVSRASPFGVNAYAALGALLRQRNKDWGAKLVEHATGAFKAALEGNRRLDAKLSLHFICDLAFYGAVSASSVCESLLGPLAAATEDVDGAGAWARADASAALLYGGAVRCCAALHGQAPEAFAAVLLKLGAYLEKRKKQFKRCGVTRNHDDAADSLELAARALRDPAGYSSLLAKVKRVDIADAGNPMDTADDDGDDVPDCSLPEAWRPALSATGVWPTLPSWAAEAAAQAAAMAEDAAPGLGDGERFFFVDAVCDVVVAFRPGARHDGIVLGSRTTAAEQLSSLKELIDGDDAEAAAAAVMADALLACVARGGAVDDGAMDAAPDVARGSGDSLFDVLHVTLELCRLSAAAAARFVTALELVYRSADATDCLALLRLGDFFAHFLNNTKFAWPYWPQWADAADYEDHDAQRIYVKHVLDKAVRLTYVDRIKCIEGFPTELHALLPDAPTPVDDVSLFRWAANDSGVQAALEAAANSQLEDISAALEEDEDDDDAPLEKSPLGLLFAALSDDASRAAVAVHAVMCASSASISHTMAVLDRADVSSALRDVVYGDDGAERAALDAVSGVWKNSPQHVKLYVDALVRRCIVRPSAVVAYVFRAAEAELFSATNLATDPAATLELIATAVDRSLDFVAAATLAASDDTAVLENAVEDAKKTCDGLFWHIALGLDKSRRSAKKASDDDAAASEAWAHAAESCAADAAKRYARAEAAEAACAARSTPALASPRILDSAALREKCTQAGLDVPASFLAV